MSAAPKATRREWVGLAVLGLPCILATMDLTVLNLAVPHLTADLKPTASQLLWIMDIYGFLIAGSLITMGTLGDRIGRRKLLMIGAGFFGLASVAAAFSRSAEALIVTRALLGVAGATLAPSTLSLIRNMFLDPRERTVAVGVWVTCFSAGATMGPVLGGVVLEHFRWGAVFLMNVPVMLLLLALGPVLLPEFRDEKAGRLDIASAAMSVAAVLLMIYGLKRIAESGFDAPAVAAVAAGGATGWLFVRRQLALSDPLIDLRLFRSGAFSACLSLNLLGCVAAYGMFFFVAQHFQLVMGLSPLHAGLMSVPSSIAFSFGAMLCPPLVRRASPGAVVAVGLVFAAAGFAMLAGVGPSTPGWWIVASLVVYSLGLTPVFTLGTDLIISAAPAERAGAAASMSETASEFGGALGMAVLGSLGMAFYRVTLTPLLPAGLPEAAVRAAKGTLGAALETAATLPPDAGAALASAARFAFTSTLRHAAVGCAIIALIMTVIAARVLRRKPS